MPNSNNAQSNSNFNRKKPIIETNDSLIKLNTKIQFKSNNILNIVKLSISSFKRVYSEGIDHKEVANMLHDRVKNI